MCTSSAFDVGREKPKGTTVYNYADTAGRTKENIWRTLYSLSQFADFTAWHEKWAALRAKSDSRWRPGESSCHAGAADPGKNNKLSFLC